MTFAIHDLHRVTAVEEVEAIIGNPPAVVLAKELDHLDEGCKSILAHSPVAAMGYLTGPDGHPVSTYVGGGAGFAQMLGPHKISVPLPGGYDPPMDGSGISFAFLLPGVGEVLRLNGRVVKAGPATEIRVQQAFVHCAKAIQRSRLWRPAGTDGMSVVDAVGTTKLDDRMVTDFLARSTFLMVSTWAGDGTSDTSPRGDSPGFVQVLDADTIAIPDRKGNKRADTFHNLVDDGRISTAVLCPGSDVALHLDGTGFMSDEPELLATMAIKGVPPHGALVVKVDNVSLRGNTAIAESKLWDLSPGATREMPNMMALASRHVVIMSNRERNRSALGLAFGVLAKYPRLAKAVANLTYKSELKGEGYPGAESPPDRSSSAAGGEDMGGRLGRLWKRLRPTKGKAVDAADPGLREVTVIDVVRESTEATTLILEDLAGSTFDFKPGQFFTISARIGERTVRRAYSASSSPGGHRLAITVKRVADGFFSTHINTNVRIGDRLELLGPSGSFCIPDPSSAPRNLVLIAAGSGITPIMSILRTMLANTADSRVTLLYGNRSERDIIFAETLNELGAAYPERLEVRHVLSRPSPTWAGPTGRLEQAVLESELDSMTIADDSHYYICGPEGLMDGARNLLIDRGVDQTRIHRERFVRAVDEFDAHDLAAQTMVVESGDGQQLARVTIQPGDTLLQAGLSAGVPMPYSCTVGNCGDCMVKLLDGSVSIGEPNCLEGDQRAAGYILTCIGRPTSPVRIAIEESD